MFTGHISYHNNKFVGFNSFFFIFTVCLEKIKRQKYDYSILLIHFCLNIYFWLILFVLVPVNSFLQILALGHFKLLNKMYSNNFALSSCRVDIMYVLFVKLYFYECNEKAEMLNFCMRLDVI